MRAGGSGCERHIDAIVHEHGHRQRSDEGPGEVQHIGGSAVLPAHLDHGGPASGRLTAYLHGIAPLE